MGQTASAAEEPSAEPSSTAAIAQEHLLTQLGGLGYAGDAEEDELATLVGPLYDAQRCEPGPTLINYRQSAALIDPHGKLLRQWRAKKVAYWSSSEVAPNGDLWVVGMRAVAQADRPPRTGVWRFAQDGKLRFFRPVRGAHHDLAPLPAGGLAVLATVALDEHELDTEFNLIDESIAILDAEGREQRRVSILKMLLAGGHGAPFFPGSPAEHAREGIELFHANAIEILPEPPAQGAWDPRFRAGLALVTLRNQDLVALFDLQARSVLWSFGRDELWGPHDGQLLANGNVLVFDNGQRKAESGSIHRAYSRVVEVDPRTNTIVWEYRADPPESLISLSRGSAQRLPGGNTLIGVSDRGWAVEVTSQGTPVWRWFASPSEEEKLGRATFFRVRRFAPNSLLAR